MTLHAPLSPAVPARRARSLESRGLHFIEHHQPLIWAAIGVASLLAVMLRS